MVFSPGSLDGDVVERMLAVIEDGKIEDREVFSLALQTTSRLTNLLPPSRTQVAIINVDSKKQMHKQSLSCLTFNCLCFKASRTYVLRMSMQIAYYTSFRRIFGIY